MLFLVNGTLTYSPFTSSLIGHDAITRRVIILVVKTNTIYQTQLRLLQPKRFKKKTENKVKQEETQQRMRLIQVLKNDEHS